MEMTDKKDYVFSLDIGTRSIIGMVGVLKNEKLNILAIEKEEHSSRAMIDGQIEDISRVARVAESVRKKLEEKTGLVLEQVHVAAAGRALKTGKATYELELPEAQTITEDIIKNLETGAITEAERKFEEEAENDNRQFYLVGYSVCQYYLDDYPISNLQDHKGKRLKADVIATFLPGEVVESLYVSMKKSGVEVASMTLEPIASMNAAIPQKLRLLNLVLVDIGAGTSDIAAARDGSISGYTMATVAGDEITECLMKEYLIDFDTAEALKIGMALKEELEYIDVLGFEHTVASKAVQEVSTPTIQSLCKQIAEKVLEVNGSVPSAVFLTGGGSKLTGVREAVAQYLEMDLNRVALGGNNFSIYAESEEYDLKDPEYSTPLGIAVSAAFNLISDSFYIKLNGQRAKLFRSGKLTVRDVLMMNGYGYRHLISHSGQNLVLNIGSRRTVIHGGYSTPAYLQVNGKDAVISDLIQAGDEITFHPAVNGEDARAVLGDVAELEIKGYASWDEMDIPLGSSAFVNGEPAGKERELHSGDRIEICTIETAGDFAEHYEIEALITVNGIAVPPEWKLEPGDILGIKEAAKTEEADSPAEAVIEKTEPSLPNETQKEALAEQAAALLPEGQEEQKEPEDRDSLSFTLNGKKLKLQKKPNDTPYFLMDMLTYTDLDVSKPKGNIQLNVNGESAGFQNELKNGDVIIIGWSEEMGSHL